MSLYNTEIIIVSFNTKRLIQNCLESIEKSTSGHNIKITIVDNGSTDGSIQLIQEKFPHINLIQIEKNIGYGAAMNVGIKSSKKE